MFTVETSVIQIFKSGVLEPHVLDARQRGLAES
jgi:hypothetical protein